MKSIFLSLLLWPISILVGFSQNCEFAENSVDKFTKVRTLSTKFETIWLEGALLSRVNLTFAVGMADSTKVIIAQMNCNNTPNYDWFDSFDSMWLMNESGNVVALVPYDRCKYNFAGDSDWVSYWQYYLVSDSTWMELSNFSIASIRVNMEDTSGIPFYDLEVKEKNRNILSNGVNCVNAVIENDSKKKN